jgi:hypothetical protein
MQPYGKDALLAVLGILGGGVISFFFYRRSLQRAEISFASEYTRLIWSRIPAFANITLLQGGQQLHDPRRVLYYVWNSGNTTIEGAMIAAADPIRLKAGDVRIINAAIVKRTRDAICANVNLTNGERPCSASTHSALAAMATIRDIEKGVTPGPG